MDRLRNTDYGYAIVVATLFFVANLLHYCYDTIVATLLLLILLLLLVITIMAT